MVALLDADTDLVTDQFAERVEAGRAGYVFARNDKAYSRWRRQVDRRTGRVPAGKSLAELARQAGAGGQVVVGQFEFRN